MRDKGLQSQPAAADGLLSWFRRKRMKHLRIPVKWSADSDDVGQHRSEATLVRNSHQCDNIVEATTTGTPGAGCSTLSTWSTSQIPATTVTAVRPGWVRCGRMWTFE